VALRVAEVAYRTDTGRQRTANEDSFFASAPLFAVADGMGGAQAGEVASRIAAESFAPAERSAESSPEAYLRTIAETANERIHTLAQNDSSRSGMGTTLTAALVEGDDVSFAHVGDSRAYVYRDGELRLLTSDHSLVEELRRQGRLTPEQAEDHPQRSIITRALGPESEVEVDTLSFSARPGDVFLICSDGLTTMIKEDAIAAALAESDTLDQAAIRLISEANEAGGRDNITVVAFALAEGEATAAEEGATLVGPSAADAGLTGERVRAAAARRERTRGGPPKRRRRVRTAAKVLVALLIVAGLVAAGVYGARQVYFLGVDEGGRVALFRGLPYELPFDLDLYSEVYSAPVQAASVPEDRHESFTGHELRSREDAVSLLDDLQAAATPPLPQPPQTPPARPGAGAGAPGQSGGGQSGSSGGTQAEGNGGGKGDGRSRDGGGRGSQGNGN
jgi:PPM family protein phosphatase